MPTKTCSSTKWKAIAVLAVLASAAPLTVRGTTDGPTLTMHTASAGGMGGGMGGGGMGGGGSGGVGGGSGGGMGAGGSGGMGAGVGSGGGMGGFGGMSGSHGGMNGTTGMSGAAMGTTAAGATTAAHSSMHPSGFIADEVVVATANAAALEQWTDQGYAVVDQHELGSLGVSVVRLRVPPGLTPETALAQLQQSDPSLLADVNSLYQPQGQLTLPSPDYPHRLIGWRDSTADCGAGQRIGMIDTAIETGIPALADRQIVQRAFRSPGSPAAPSDHGTAIADLLVGRATSDGPAGLLPAATLYAGAVFDEGADGQPQGDVVNLMTALDWLISQQVPVINLSLAGDDNRLLHTGIARALSKHVLIVAAAGNGGADAGPAYPAAYPGVLAVTAVDGNRQPYAQANHGDYISFAAPGVQVWASTAEGGQYFTGTSFAAPFASAAVSAELKRGAPPDPTVVEERLARSAISLGESGRSPVYGWGLLQATSGCHSASIALPK